MTSEGFIRDTSELGGGSVGIKWNGPICARLKLQLINVTTVKRRVYRIIDNSFYFFFGEDEQCA